MKCDKIMNLMAEHLIKRTLGEEQLKLMIRHIANCNICMNQLGAMLSILSGKDICLTGLLPKTFTCSEFAELLSEYAEMDEENIKEIHPKAWFHLKCCPTCKESYLMTKFFFDEKDGVDFENLVYDLAASSERGEKGSNALIQVWQEVQKGFRNLSTVLNIMVSKGRETFEQIPLWLESFQTVSVPVSGRVLRGKEAMEGNIYQLSIPDQIENRQIALATRLNYPDEADVRISLMDTRNDSPVYGATVTLFDAMSLFLENAITDERNNGVVEFGKLKFGKYKFRIEDMGTTWEIAICLS